VEVGRVVATKFDFPVKKFRAVCFTGKWLAFAIEIITGSATPAATPSRKALIA
jgi:hypothetical protein